MKSGLNPVLRIENVEAFSASDSINYVTFDAEQGDVVSLVGPNGSGKSTLLRAIAGLIPVRSGQIFVQGKRQTSASPVGLIGIQIDQIAMYSWLTARQNLRSLSLSYGVDNWEAIDRAISRFSIQDFQKRRVRTYSEGMRRRLDLAAASLMSPPIILLDEPSNGLDTEGRELLFAWIREESTRGTVFVIASHTQAERDIATKEITLTVKE
jgi:ABC-2 type transport system ATP-binding protein